METRAHHILIGLFTVLVVVAGLAFGVWLAKTRSDQEWNYYDVVFNEAVTGLSKGGAVQYNGIRLGDVTQLRLDPDDPRRVLARIRVSGDTPLRKDTHAKLALTGVTGVAFIQLSGGSPGSPLIVGHDGEVPLIVADPSPFARLLANGEDLVTNINQVAARANDLLSKDNVHHIEHMLEHLDKTTGVIADEREDIRDLIKQLTIASRQANATLAETQKLVQNANGLVQNQGKPTLESAQRAMASLEHTTASIDRLLNDNSDAINGGAQSLGDLAPALRDLRDTLNSLRSITRRLDENPSGYLFGRDKTKEFTP
ncbi:phospholipid/cholesterol/gamma-HCH transport system substrate-binding protein [Luteibacter rhizovicinus]|uniref:Phospholipid/cholesterol/gamma-HCH transport system substrate-binding protein n=1 Tax=Luteibacter rhizovicinus TaxID=242606 RepID=A0A4R3YRX4_9GAMM|nr:MlaD family protein [Luteibacter rhizovicinus]TCV95735.1 phospholipid/cholesterol/gamma-HCH transport system substrate-binding protein [Luteibacter rhizovicinus]